MTKRLFIIVPLLGCFLSISSYAANCDVLSSEVQMKQCVAQEYEQLDKQLNDIYSQYRSRLNNKQKQQLKEVQSVWLKYRDLSCDFEASGSIGGSAHVLARTQCLSQKTRVRMDEIKNLLTCEEGDLNCPVWK